RLRGALRRVVDVTWCLFVDRGRDRLAAVQFHFAGGGCRNYVILSRPALGGFVRARPAQWWARSFAEVAAVGAIDLRRSADVKKVERLLLSLDLDALAE